MSGKYIFCKGVVYDTSTQRCKGGQYAKKLIKLLKKQGIKDFKYRELKPFKDSLYADPMIEITF